MVSAKKVSIICYCATFLIFLVIFLWGSLGLLPGDELGFSILNFYLIMPFVSFAAALLLGIKNAYMKWIYPLFTGVSGFIIPSLLFGGIDLISLFFSLIPSVIGLGIGLLIWKFRSEKEVE